jgi:hypothetical protein
MEEIAVIAGIARDRRDRVQGLPRANSQELKARS